VYMSPEQMRSTRDVDHRTDIWSLGVLLFKLLTGDVPFPGKTIPDVCARILVDETPSIRGTRSDIPEAVDAVIRRCLSKSPQDRFQSVGELAAALGPAVALSERARIERILKIESPADGRVLSTSDRVSIPGSDFRQGDVPTIVGPAETPPEPAPERRSGRWMIGAGAALALAVTAYALLARSPTPPAGAATKSATLEPVPPPVAASPPTRVGDEVKPESSVTLPIAPSAMASPIQSAPGPAKGGARSGPRHVSSSVAGPTAPPPPPPSPKPAPTPAGDEHPLHL
jgi:serine/threonine-protein kinase